MMDSRKLLTFIYILKAVTKTLRNYVRQNVDKINSLIKRSQLLIIKTLQNRNTKSFFPNNLIVHLMNKDDNILNESKNDILSIDAYS